jgi:hypothetical protein
MSYTETEFNDALNKIAPFLEGVENAHLRATQIVSALLPAESTTSLREALKGLVVKWRNFADTDYTAGQKLSDARKQGQYELMMAGQSLAYATAAKELSTALSTTADSTPPSPVAMTRFCPTCGEQYGDSVFRCDLCQTSTQRKTIMHPALAHSHR